MERPKPDYETHGICVGDLWTVTEAGVQNALVVYVDHRITDKYLVVRNPNTPMMTPLFVERNYFVKLQNRLDDDSKFVAEVRSSAKKILDATDRHSVATATTCQHLWEDTKNGGLRCIRCGKHR